MNRRKWTFTLLAVVLGALCVRLGFWQLDRHGQRQELIQAQAARLDLPPVPLTEAPAALENEEALVWRRVALRGRWDFEREIVLRNRSLHGSPGVHVVTPFLLQGPEGEAAILVRRGWLPAPDGLRAHLAGGRPADAAGDASGRTGDAEDPAEIAGVAMPPEPGVGETSPPTYPFGGEEHVALIRLDPEAAAPLLPYPVAGFIVQATEGTEGTELRPLPLPELDSGPHIFYAIQWFSFAAIAVIGISLWLRRVDDPEGRRSREL